MKQANYIWVQVVLGLLVFALGGAVFFDWYFPSVSIVQLLPEHVHTHYISAIGLMVLGFGLIFLTRVRYISGVVGISLFCLGIVTLSSYVFRMATGYQQSFLDYYIQSEPGYDGIMTPNTAVCFALLGMSYLITDFYGHIKHYISIAYVLAVITTFFAFVAIYGYLSGFSEEHVWTIMSMHTSIGLILVSMAVCLLLWQHSSFSFSKNNIFISVLIGVCSFLLFSLFSVAFKNNEVERINQISSHQTNLISNKIEKVVNNSFYRLRYILSTLEDDSLTADMRKKQMDRYIAEYPYIQAIYANNDVFSKKLLDVNSDMTRERASRVIKRCHQVMNQQSHLAAKVLTVDAENYYCISGDHESLIVIHLKGLLSSIWGQQYLINRFGVTIKQNDHVIFERNVRSLRDNEDTKKVSSTITIIDAKWNITYYLDIAYFDNQHVNLPVMFFIFGLLFSTLLVLLIRSKQLSLYRLESLKEAYISQERLNTKFNLAVKSAEIGTWQFNIRSRQIEFDKQASILLSLDHEEEVSCRYDEVITKIHPNDRRFVYQQVYDALRKQSNLYCEFRFAESNEDYRFLCIRAKLLETDSGSCLSGVCWDVTQQKRFEQKVAEAEDRKIAMDDITDGWWDWDLKLGQGYLSPKLKRMFGYDDQELSNSRETWDQLIFAEDNRKLKENLKAHVDSETKVPFAQEVRFYHKQGHTVWVICRGKAIKGVDGSYNRMVGSHTDITALKEAEAQLKHMATYDNLTNIPNRPTFLQQLKKEIKRANRRKQSQLAVFFVDVDNFKQINDVMGHYVGDTVLKEVSRRFKHNLRSTDYLARLGGDEFAVILPDIENVGAIEVICSKLIRAFDDLIIVDDNKIRITISIGVALYPDCGDTPDELIQKADSAMYRAKEMGKNNFAIYSEHLHHKLLRQRDVETALRDALKNDEFTIHYQPQFTVDEQKMWGVEALIRWNNKALGYPSPDEFIPIAELIRMIKPIGLWVLRKAIEDYVQMLSHKPCKNLMMSINVSTSQLLDRDMIDCVNEQLEKTDIDPRSITFEITETTLMQNIASAKDELLSLNSQGFNIALDDFGTGYSSMYYLKSLPVDYIKIDKKFVADIHKTENADTLISGMILLAKSLGVSVVAEGVETQSQLNFLKKVGCHTAQGYYFAKAMSLDDLVDFCQSLNEGSEE